MRLSRRRFLAIAGASLAGGGAYASLIEPVWLRTRAQEVVLPRLHAGLDGYTVAQLSDIHIGGGAPLRFLRRGIAAANAADPDLVVVTGDIVDRGGQVAFADTAAELLSRLRCRDGVYAVLGNHDTGAYEPKRADPELVRYLVGRLGRAGVPVLSNGSVMVERAGGWLRVAGFGDLWSGDFDPDRVGLDGCTIALSHNPDTAPELAERSADLILCGHTHGGQVDLPFFGPPYLPLRHKQFVRGAYRIGDTSLYVNPGLGWSRRLRFGVRPEVTIHRLRKAPSRRSGTLV